VTAKITNYFRRQSLAPFIGSLDSDYYYIAVGRSQDWVDSDGAGTLVVDAETGSDKQLRDLRNNMQYMRRVVDGIFVAPRVNWSSGTTYSAYDDMTVDHTGSAWYVITQTNDVYICLQQGKTALGSSVTSTVQPTGTATTPFTTADGYVWKYLFTVGATNANTFLSSNYIPVPFITGTPPFDTSSEVDQYNVQQAATPGEIVGIAVTSGGTGYTSVPSVVITGPGGTSATATATVSGGAVVKVEMTARGSGYEDAIVTFTGGGGTGAAARAIISKQGIGADARTDMNATGVMFNTKLEGDADLAYILNDFQQAALFTNPKVPITDSDFTGTVGSTLRRLRFDIATFTGTLEALPKNLLVEQTPNGVSAYVDKFDSDTIWYHQTRETGFADFVPGDQITWSGGSATLYADSATALIEADVDKYSGQILHIDNFAAVSRNTNTTDDIKIVVQF